MNSTYPFDSYTPSGFGATSFAIFVYLSLVAWFVQSLHGKCQPRLLSVFVFVAHLTVFIELVLRATVHNDVLHTTTLYKIRAPLISVPARFILLANYHCLVELRGQKPHRPLDRIIDAVVLVFALSADILLAIANELSLKPNHLYLSFYLRQASAICVLSLALFYYLVWYLAVPHVRRLYVLPLLAISSACVLIEAVYILLTSIPFLFNVLSQKELWFYVGHLVPLAVALCSWSIYHPWRLLPPLERDIPHDSAGKELLPPPSLI
ncbi:unnamed protein product [Adineta ricciae]|uniref:Uncharacterized protein n=1 Tax=Adineta ricciae TaxID=249248 RepID=A0A815LHQ1_ADIRI|nr:unnamed protein product [Adineta ricciae]CAF1410199.1 unnamed protein product [Adineta ricciae]